VESFAIIDRLQLEFQPGLNVLTGETGAGKSIIIDAVGLLLGGRGGIDMIRAGADRALIEGVFSLGADISAALTPLLLAEGLEDGDPDRLTLARELRREGRNVCRVNGRSVALKVLEQVSQRLVDIHGQTEHLSLMRVREHVDLLDRFGRLWPARAKVSEVVRALRKVRGDLAALRQDERKLARRVDLLRYQVSEIEAARLGAEELQDLTLEQTRLANAEQLIQLSEGAYKDLFESDEGPTAVDLVQDAVRSLSNLERLDGTTASLRELAESVGYQLEELAGSLRSYRDDIEFSPDRLLQVEERLALINSLTRKYGETVADVLAFAQRAQAELDTIEHSEERIEELEAEQQRLLDLIGSLGAALSRDRQAAATRLSSEVESELKELNMERAHFGVDIVWNDVDGGAPVDGRTLAFDLTGLDRVEFLIAPNVGEPLKPLVRIASGGETSRLMLALKTVLAYADHTPTLIFDEIDSGIGGRVGAVVGQKLWRLAAGSSESENQHQVLCVTHLPQLASYGDLHLKVEKGIVEDRTVTEVRVLEGRDRVRELAAMLGVASSQTQASAQEMLEASQKDKGIGSEAA
jgi:DNA repair protein RecN (Recombination protein N)